MQADPGCLKTTLGVIALVLLSPIVALARLWSCWRRGGEVVMRWRQTVQGVNAVFDVHIDAPAGAELTVRSQLTDHVVRLAEALHRPDDRYHRVYRQPDEPEPSVLPIGPQIQSLGERLALALGRVALQSRTVLWVVLPREVVVGEILDPLTYDPEAEGEPERLLAQGQIRWAVASAYTRRGPGTVYRAVLFVPEKSAQTVEGLLARLRDRLC